MAALMLVSCRPDSVFAEPVRPKPKAFVHPGITLTSSNLDFVKAKLEAGEEPWKAAWEELVDSRYAKFRRSPRPRAHVSRGPYGNPDLGAKEFVRDGTAAYTHALIWAIKQENAHAQKAAEILSAWSDTLKSIRHHDAALLVGMSGQQYCIAAEILKHTSDVWPTEEQEHLSLIHI